MNYAIFQLTAISQILRTEFVLRALIVLSLAPLSLCGRADEQSSVSINNPAAAALVQCLRDRSQDLDDGSSVLGVAEAINAACSKEFADEIIAISRGLPNLQQNQIRERLQKYTRGKAAEFVLEYRKSKSGDHAKPKQAPDATAQSTYHIKSALDATQCGDIATAVRHSRWLAEHGEVSAQIFMGVSYEDGKGVPQDYRKAFRWWRMAAEAGNAGAQFMVGLRLADGKAGRQDVIEAVKWL